MQTTDPRRTPRPDSEERTQKPGAAARPHPVNRRAPRQASESLRLPRLDALHMER